MRPIIGIPACTKIIADLAQHATPARYGAALIACADRLDGILFNGSPSNVEPGRYGVDEDATPAEHDPARDDTTLPMIRAALERGMPILGICRGMQELNVALGGTLHQEVHQLAGRLDHRAGAGSREMRYGAKHPVSLTGQLAEISGEATIMVNSLHGQAIDRLAPGLIVEAIAPDGTIEAVRVTDAGSFALAVQWHPEWQAAAFADRARLFAAFGAACRAFRGS
ncbi:MAG: peptidase C26 [Acidiphilium sp. 34-60-192]|nr:MAG: peptidase C26 [Acidiphilium sp. 34-60-192]